MPQNLSCGLRMMLSRRHDFTRQGILDPLVQREGGGITRHRGALRAGQVREHVQHQGRVREPRRGDIELIDVDGDFVIVSMRGQCTSCAKSQTTIKELVEKKLREQVLETLIVEEEK